MWLINSSIGRKVVMSVTGTALILFLLFHASMNAVALISAEGYNMICGFLGGNWYAVAATVALAGLVLLHFLYAFWLTVQNRRARGNSRYAVTSTPDKVEWSSQNMLVLGIVVILGMGLHLYNFWAKMMLVELAPCAGDHHLAANGVYWIAETFSCPIYTVIYLVWLAALWMHLNHGLWSAMQTLGWSGKVWFNRWRAISCVISTVIILMFASVALAYCFGYKPADFEKACVEQSFEAAKPGCSKMVGCHEKANCSKEGMCNQNGECNHGEACHKGGECSHGEACSKGGECNHGEACSKKGECHHGEDCSKKGECPNAKSE